MAKAMGVRVIREMEVISLVFKPCVHDCCPTFRTEALMWVNIHLENQAYRLPRSWRKCWCASVRLITMGHG